MLQIPTSPEQEQLHAEALRLRQETYAAVLRFIFRRKGPSEKAAPVGGRPKLC